MKGNGRVKGDGCVMSLGEQATQAQEKIQKGEGGNHGLECSRGQKANIGKNTHA